MIWQNAWAWVGLGAIALPILIHLLGRGHARVQPFPTLRFLEPSRLLPTRRTRVHDVVLLVVRVGILAAAVAALAQPLFLTANRSRALDATLARAIIVDTSASMLRQSSGGERAVDVARREARRLAVGAQNRTVIETSVPSRAVAGAIAWLGRQAARGEIVIISDFQLGAIDSVSLALVPAEEGIRFSRIAVALASSTLEDAGQVDGATTITRITPSLDRTDVEWATRGPSSATNTIAIFAGANERARANAAIAAARTVAVRLPLDTTHLRDIAIVEPQFEQRAEWLRRSSNPKLPWMIDAIARLRADALLQQAARNATPLVADSSAGIVIARDASGRAAVIGVQDSASGRARLLLVSATDAGSLLSATLIASVQQAMSLASPLSELESSTVPENTLAAWQRSPAANAGARVAATANAGASDGRWLWIVVLVLLALETWLRRARAESIVEQRAHERAA